MNGEYSQPVFKHKWIKNLYYSFVSKEELTDEIKEYLLALDNGSKSLKREEFEEITSMESAMVRHPKNIKSLTIFNEDTKQTIDSIIIGPN